MIANVSDAQEGAPAPGLEYELRFCVLTKTSGRVELRYFRGPRDGEGVTMQLSPREREQFAHALAVPGFHSVLRDEGDPGQGDLFDTERGLPRC